MFENYTALFIYFRIRFSVNQNTAMTSSCYRKCPLFFSEMDCLVSITFRVSSCEHKSNGHFLRVRSLGQVMRNTLSVEQQHTSNIQATQVTQK